MWDFNERVIIHNADNKTYISKFLSVFIYIGELYLSKQHILYALISKP